MDTLATRGLVYTGSFWSKVENGRRRPTRDHLIQILEILREKGASLDIITAQEILREAGYASLDHDELVRVFRYKRVSTLPDTSTVTFFSPTESIEAVTCEKQEQKTDVLLLFVWLFYMEVLEIWRNLGWYFFDSVDFNWHGFGIPVIGIALLFVLFYFIRHTIFRAVVTIFVAFVVGIVMVSVIHRPGIIIPTLSTLGAMAVAASMLFADFIAHASDKNKGFIEVLLWGISILILLGITMNVILFMAPADAFGQMPYEMRVFRGIEILLAIVMILGILALFWFSPLLRISNSPHKLSGLSPFTSFPKRNADEDRQSI